MKGIKRFSIVLTVVLYALIAVNLPIFADDPEETPVEVITYDAETEKFVETEGSTEINKDTENKIQGVDGDIDVVIEGEGVDFVYVTAGDSEDTPEEPSETPIIPGLIEIERTEGELDPSDVTLNVAPEVGKEVVDVEATIAELGIEDGLVDSSNAENGEWKISTPEIEYVLRKVEVLGGLFEWRLYDTSTGDYETINVVVKTQDLQINEGVLTDEKTLNLKHDEYQVIFDEGDNGTAEIVLFSDEKTDILNYAKTYADSAHGEGLAIENIKGVVVNADTGEIVREGIIVDTTDGKVTLLLKNGEVEDGKYIVYLDGYYTESLFEDMEDQPGFESRSEYLREYVETVFVNPDVDYGEDENGVPTRTTYNHDFNGTLNPLDDTLTKNVETLNSHSAWARVAAIDVYVKHVDIEDSLPFIGDVTDDYIVFKGKKGDVKESEDGEYSKEYEVEYDESFWGFDWTREYLLRDVDMSIVVTDVEEREGYHPVFTVIDSEGNEIEATAKYLADKGVWVLEFANNHFGGTYTVAWNYEKNPTPKKASGYTFVATGI